MRYLDASSITETLEASWPDAGLEVLECCPVCRSGDRQLVYRNLRDVIFFCAPGEWNLFRCDQCATGYLDPRPTFETISRAYATYYTHSDATRVEQPPRSLWRKYRTAQRNAYLNQHYGYQLRPATRSSPRWLSKSRRLRFDRYVCFLPFAGQGARVLDVGCGNGRLMMQLKSVGWQVSGLEPDPRSAAQARAAGLDVHVGPVTELTTQAEFDAVIMNHVIEHLHDPVEILRCCARALKPGGMICVVTPNFGAWGHSRFGRDWFALDPPRHLTLFTSASLRAALETAGFGPVEEMEQVPAPLAICKYTNWIWRSMQIRHGCDPMRNDPPLKAPQKLASIWWGWLANRRGRLDPECAEEIVLRARRR